MKYKIEILNLEGQSVLSGFCNNADRLNIRINEMVEVAQAMDMSPSKVFVEHFSGFTKYFPVVA